MTISDAQRHKLHSKLDQVLGEEDAAVLISHLPPSGWSDVARTRDLDLLAERLETRMDARFVLVDERFETMEARFDAKLERELRVQTSRFMVGTGVLVTVIATVQTIVTQLAG